MQHFCPIVEKMGTKRAFQEDDFPELSFKQAKQVGYNKDLSSYIGDFPSNRTSLSSDFVGDDENNFCKLQFDERLGNAEISSSPAMDDKELQMDRELEMSANRSMDQDSTLEDNLCWSHVQGSFDYTVPRRLPIQFEDPYAFLLNCSPRKEVPIGPDHQAEVPQWDPNTIRKESLVSDYSVEVDSEQKLIGTCIIPMPDSVFEGDEDVHGPHGQTGCSCRDSGSIECVRQHVKEARERLRETVGDESFAELGFFDMGEEVARNWSEEDQQLFHQVIYSNSVLLSRNFWKHLSAVFPTRTKKEIVSYYFNVFMLRRRASQNRCNLLQIDSDNDEWHAADGEFYKAREDDDEDSIPESLWNQVHEGPGDSSWVENICWDKAADCRNTICDGNDGAGRADAVEEFSKRD